ncbi:hypothetical protein DFH09DRAFT_1089426 [Mycena vulgaris]|nr:hypothetical protein DFH09DRAFT_1089426 [Mycena vulgaris]
MSTSSVPPNKQRTSETQAKIDRLQELRDRQPRRRRPPLLFPSSPPTVTPPVSPPATRAVQESGARPISDYSRCAREVFPRRHCTCGSAKERESAWRSTDDRWFKVDPKAWFDYYAPPQRAVDTQVEAELRDMWEELARVKATQEAARASFQAVFAQMLLIAQSRGGAFGVEPPTIYPLPMSVLEVAKKNKAVVPVSLYLKKEALQKGHMTSALKIWLNPDLVDVKQFVHGPRPGYISFYDRKIAHFKARDKRRALLMKQ